MKQADDANETLFYIQDLLEITLRTNPKVHHQIKNALLNYAYYPTVIQSLCSLKLRPQLSLSTCLYILQQTFHIVKDSEFCSELFSSIFLSRIPRKILARIEKQWPTTNTDQADSPLTKAHKAAQSAFYLPLFKEPVHLDRMSVFQLVLTHHSTTE